MSTVAVAEGPVPRRLDREWVRRLVPLLGVGAQVALALVVIRQFQLESRTFYQVALLAAAGVIPHALLPLAWRLPAFAGLSAVGLTLAVGPTDAAWVIGAGALLVGLCHLPARPLVRGALLVAAAGALAAARGGWFAAPWSAAAWAVLGSMLMFRLALYFHAVRHEPERPTAAQAAAYFLMLPNPVFPLFPVVDFATFRRSHYARDPIGIYQTGVLWIARGLLHLLLYRVVYQHLPADPLQLSGLAELLWYVLGTFLLYLRVSGQFHLIVGMLRLYGFDLPETHRLFFLASSFTDFWRRINIYWKDFMMKLVYYPSFFRLRKLGQTPALVASTAVVFVVTWFLHGYQWFWLLGTFPRSIPDVLFWGILGVLVVISSLREIRRGRDRSLGARRWSGRLARKTVATFCAIALLWSLWSAPSVVEWAWMWRAAARPDALGVWLVVALLALGLALGGRNWTPPTRAAVTLRPWQRPTVRSAAAMLAMVVVAQPAVTARTGPAERYLVAMRSTTLNATDAAVERRGYYEQLDRGPRLGAQGWEARIRRPADWAGPEAAGVVTPRQDFMRHTLVPSNRVRFLRTELTTNAWGMRDRARVLAAAPGTRRVAVFGPSLVMGSGVPDSLTLTAQLERRLNAAGGAPVEVLNFGVTGQSLLQEMARFDELGVRFAPQVAVFTTYSSMRDQTADHLSLVLKSGWAIPYPALDSILDRWRASPALPWAELTGLLRIATDDVHAWALERIAAECRRRGIVPVLMALNLVGVPADLDTRTLRSAERAGFTVLNLTDVYGPAAGHPALVLAEWDNHPNAAGSRLIADRLFADFQQHREALGLAPTPPRTTTTP